MCPHSTCYYTICVLILLDVQVLEEKLGCMRPHTTITYTCPHTKSSILYTCPHTTILYTCPHTKSSDVCVLILLYYILLYYIRVLILLGVQMLEEKLGYMRPHTTILYTCPHTTGCTGAGGKARSSYYTIYASSYYYTICVLILLGVQVLQENAREAAVVALRKGGLV